MSRVSKRRFLKSIPAVGAVGLAGCTGGDGGSGDGSPSGSDGETDGGSTGNGDGRDEEPITLTFQSLVPEGHYRGTTANMWLDAIQERTDRPIEFEKHWAGALGPPNTYIQLLQEGTVDISFIGPTYQPDLIPLTGVFSLPASFDLDEMQEAHEVANSILFDQLIDHEYSDLGIRPLYTSLEPPYNVHANGEITSTDDWNGLNVRSGGGAMSTTVQTLGGNPVEMPGVESFEALDRGTIDASILPYAFAVGLNYQEVLSHGSGNLNLASFASVYAINEATLSELPESVRNTVIETPREIATTRLGEFVEETERNSRSSMEDSGYTVFDVPSDLVAEWESDLMENVVDTWTDRVNHSNADEVLDAWMSNW